MMPKHTGKNKPKHNRERSEPWQQRLRTGRGQAWSVLANEESPTGTNTGQHTFHHNIEITTMASTFMLQY